MSYGTGSLHIIMSDAMTTEVTTGVDASTSNSSDGESFEWTVATIAQSIALFFLAGLAEIVGGWMVW